ncbi:GLPGLI family protein [Dokdonia sp. 4H-3-7-5]|uniref:GLPGLI family protein n=1 Tax=Dokdonia sp. (strain 4H-3-7-5) TaxID=983548 RepID=UPI00020A69DF|nr:GLPGLI family protein [Dokdonia sp. 4H-3-7-5]AEE19003.1 hypothetical protein Krodi_1019 [Dokdonia sp. 4H-3-7-5]
MFLKKIIILLSVFISNTLFAQNELHIFEYEAQYNLGKSLIKKGYLFKHNNQVRYQTSIPIFLENLPKLNLDTADGVPEINIKFGHSNENTITNLEDKVLLNVNSIGNDVYVTEEVINPNTWIPTGISKNIAGRNCTEFTATFRGRDYKAYVDLSVPINYGPWKLQGLPGLVVYAEADDGILKWQLTTITKKKITELSSFMQEQDAFITSHDVISLKEFVLLDDAWRANGSPVIASRLPREYRRSGSRRARKRGGKEIAYEWEE